MASDIPSSNTGPPTPQTPSHHPHDTLAPSSTTANNISSYAPSDLPFPRQTYPQQRAYSVTAMPHELQRTVQRQQQQQAEQQQRQLQEQPWWQYYYQLYHYHPPLGRKPTVFGPYLLLQTLGEGEFGKVKLAIHIETGHETVRHPYIVKLYDVIETEKYIGIILQCASGGELFEYILAHRYLKEKDASRLFAQLISGVHYMHQKHIVHRDLKLENLLLDRHRSIIITDFGFANQFSSSRDALMSTSCGSPCYAAPELVISEGLYVGSAVDIWSCGVILYAMLCGYLPFDDDPANPDGDNINLLYKYILNTPLAFPDYISFEAQDLLQKMLVPDPVRRCTMDTIMNHAWLSPHRSLFQKSTAELEQTTDDNLIKAVNKTPSVKSVTLVPEVSQSPLVPATELLLSSASSSSSSSSSSPSSPQAQVQAQAQVPQSSSSTSSPSLLLSSSLSQSTAAETQPREAVVISKNPSTKTKTKTTGSLDPHNRDISSFELPAAHHNHHNNLGTNDTNSDKNSQEVPTMPDPAPVPSPSKTTNRILHFLATHSQSTPRQQSSSNHHHQSALFQAPTGSILQAKFLSSIQRNPRTTAPAPGGVSVSTPFNGAFPRQQLQQQLHQQNGQTQTSSRVTPQPTIGTSHPVRGTRRKALSLLVNSVTDYIGHDDNTKQRLVMMPSVSEQSVTSSALEKEKHRSAGKKIMDWFKKKPQSSKESGIFGNNNSSSRLGGAAHTPNGANDHLHPSHPVRAMHIGKALGSYAVDFNDSKLRTHHGAVDQDALTSRPPHEVFVQVKQALGSMGIDVKRDGEYKLKCTRRKR
ncbi:kinase-like domain-containing protein, partial [Phycomyces blakesleeanus]